MSEVGAGHPIGTAGTALPLRALEDPVERVIAPAKRRLRPRDLFAHGAVVKVLAVRDFKAKYKQSLLGPLWLVFQPLALLAAFFVAFRGLGDVDTFGIPYAAFALTGLTVWTFFQASMTIGAASILTNFAFVRFTPCPRTAFPIAATIASLPAFAVTAIGAIATAAVTGHLSARVVLLPLAAVWLMLLTLGAVGIVSALAVRYRDIISALPFLLQVGLFFAPVGYSLASLSPAVRRIVELNPLTGLIEAVRWMVLDSYYPHAGLVVSSIVLTLITAVAGWLVFSRRETTMADDI